MRSVEWTELLEMKVCHLMCIIVVNMVNDKVCPKAVLVFFIVYNTNTNYVQYIDNNRMCEGPGLMCFQRT